MTVVAGCILPDGALLGADSRVTVRSSDGSTYVSDNAAKIIRLGPATAVGYSGDLATVSWLFGHLFGPQLKRRRLDPVSVRRWLPRFLRDTYARLARRYPVGSVVFLVASSVKGRLTRMPKALVLATLQPASDRELNNWLVLRLLNNINCPGDFFDIPDSSMGMLYKLESPNFLPIDYGPLSFAAIGSCRAARDSLNAYELLFAVDHPNRAVVWFLDAMVGFLRDTEEDTVGGLLLIVAAQHGRVTAIGYEDDPQVRKARVGITLKDGRFVAHVDGREVILRYPGELQRQGPLPPLVLDDLKKATQAEVERRASLRARLDPNRPSTKSE